MGSKPLHKHRRALEDSWDERGTKPQGHKKQFGATYKTFTPTAEQKKAIRKAVEDGSVLDGWIDRLPEFGDFQLGLKYSPRENSWKATLHQVQFKFNEGIYLCGYHQLPSVALAVLMFGLVEYYQCFPGFDESARSEYDW